MKVLIISESESTLESYSNFFEKYALDTICYSWLIKAIDNIAEIKPDVIVVNAIDFPRNWKVLIQYARQIYDGILHCAVIISENADEDELAKIEALDVVSLGENFTETEDGSAFVSVLKDDLNKICSKVESVSVVQEGSDVSTDVELTKTQKVASSTDSKSTRWLSCPLDEKNSIIGKVIRYNHPVIILLPSDIEQMQFLNFGKKIDNCTLYDEGLPSRISVQVQGIDDTTVELCILS